VEYLLGKTAKEDIINSYGVTVVPAMTVITEHSLRLMAKHKIDPAAVLILLKDTAVAEEPLVDSVMKCVEDFKSVFETTAVLGKIPLIEIRQNVVPVITEIGVNHNVFELFEAVRAKDEYTHVHNVGVSVLSTLIGKWIKLPPNQLASLSLAALLHDVGKIKIPSELLLKPGKLTDEEYALIKKHTIYGYELLRATPGISAKIARVALQHHEREDGGGYPLGLKKENIDLFSSIVAVADIFHAMSSCRPYHEPLSFHEIISQMRDGKFGKLNPYIVSVFIENTMNRLIGQRVVLTDGREGEVVYLNPHRMERPLIKLQDDFLDLSKETGVHIKAILT